MICSRCGIRFTYRFGGYKKNPVLCAGCVDLPPQDIAKRRTLPYLDPEWSNKLYYDLEGLGLKRKEWDWLEQIVLSYWVNRRGVFQHGLRNLPKRYRLFKNLRLLRLIRKKGYHYFPTRHGFLLYLHRRNRKNPLRGKGQLDKYFERAEAEQQDREGVINPFDSVEQNGKTESG